MSCATLTAVVAVILLYIFDKLINYRRRFYRVPCCRTQIFNFMQMHTTPRVISTGLSSSGCRQSESAPAGLRGRHTSTRNSAFTLSSTRSRPVFAPQSGQTARANHRLRRGRSSSSCYLPASRCNLFHTLQASRMAHRRPKAAGPWPHR